MPPADTGGPHSVALRDLEWTDLETLAVLERELFADDAWSVESWWHELAGRPRRDYVVAVDGDGQIVGYAGLDRAGETGDVMTVAVVPAARGRGLGHHLLGELVRRAELSGIRSLLLEVRADNASARRLYERNGFDVISVRRKYYQPDGVDALVMRKLIGGANA
ncbi:alanine acetyltransferase [Intrasporangium chromatireducens Q5-1]|uniref:Alanine acetyltransferase n=1 Tax=Intrasporangium chromatireducens Q5-1 TaxID=584657 RepID=W9GIX2_9MICO|nr:ribosomal protein S18-alanine N-acetyltransferase [Intrasporangium chromatireducens]EWT04773.1 alanine acetyltransferase [Intrasporangium chromatireducens Q5-1]